MENELKQAFLGLSKRIVYPVSQSNFEEIRQQLDRTGKSHSCKNEDYFVEATIYGRNPNDNVVHMEPNPHQLVYLIAGQGISYEKLQILQNKTTEKRKLGCKAFLLVDGQEI